MAGLKKGQRVAFLGESSLEWVVNFFAVLIRGGVVVPLDVKLTEIELGHIIEHTEPSIIFSSKKYRSLARNLRLIKPGIKALALESTLSAEDYQGLPTEALSPVKIGGEDLAVISYTSGTSGAPNGVMVPVRALLFEADATHTVNDCEGHDVVLSILPLNHLYGLCAGVLHSLRSGQEFCFAHDLGTASIVESIRARKVTQILAIPLFAKMLMRSIVTKATESPSRSRRFAFRAGVKSMKKAPSKPLQKLFFKKIKSAIGPSLKRIICGGAELDPEIGDFFRAIGIPIYIGYGLTETGPVISVNTEKKHRRGSVGRVLPEVEVKIVDGEIWTRGPNLMQGYYKNPALTSEVMTEDGWFRTGDIGELDKDGYLYIRGRKKSLIVLSSGKKVHPEEVERALSASAKIKDVCVLGLKTDADMGELVTAVVLPAEEEVSKLGFDSPELRKLIEDEVRSLSSALAPFKRPIQIIIYKAPFTMTTTMKIKRHMLMREFAENRAQAILLR